MEKKLGAQKAKEEAERKIREEKERKKREEQRRQRAKDARLVYYRSESPELLVAVPLWLKAIMYTSSKTRQSYRNRRRDTKR